MPANDVTREIVGPQANHLMMLLFLWEMVEDADAYADEDFSRALLMDDWIDPLSDRDAEALEMSNTTQEVG